MFWQTQELANPLQIAVSEIEQDLGARAGIYMHDLHTEETLTYNADTRFPMNSTFKLFACAALLSRVEKGLSQLSDSVDLRDLPLVGWSPAVTESIKARRTTVSLDQLCRMMLSVSDNTAANFILSEIGGPKGFTDFMRSIGDEVTRLDRWYPELNEGMPNDLRDTTTPRAIGKSLQKILLGNSLSLSSKETLREWLSGHLVSEALFRSILPSTWSILDRTGAGSYGARSIVAVMYPPDREPIVVTLYMRDTQASFDRRNAAIASIGKLIVSGELLK